MVLTSSRLPVPHGFPTREGGLPLGFEDRVAMLTQVHGSDIVEASGSTAPAIADGIWTEEPERAVAVRTADCAPILMVDPEGRRVAAVHSGWRGTDLRIAARAVETLVSRGSRANRLLAAVGPTIRACCYEVSPDLAKRFSDGFGADVVTQVQGRPHLDLVRAIQITLLGAGLLNEHVDALPFCTCCDSSRFFSYRREKGTLGRHLNFIACRF